MQDLTLYQDRHKKILSLDFEFDKNLEERWMWKYNKTKSFVEKNNKFPSNYSKDPVERSLGYWATKQKVAKRKGKLSSEKIKICEKIKLWIWDNDLDGMWTKKHNQTKSFAEKNNKLPSQHSKNTVEKKLGLWSNKQKIEKRKGKLSSGRIKICEKIKTWVWDTDLGGIWMENYNQTKSFAEKNNKLPLQHSKNIVEKRLGCWGCTQKKKKRKGTLSSEKISLLEKIPGWKW